MKFFIGVYKDYENYLFNRKLDRNEVVFIGSYKDVLARMFYEGDEIIAERRWLVNDFHKIIDYVDSHRVHKLVLKTKQKETE